MYYICEAIYYEKNPLTEEEYAAVHKAHVAKVNQGIEKGVVLLGGPKAAGGGGFLICKAASKEELDAFLNSDPMVVNKVQYFKVTPWKILDISENLKGLI